MSSPPVKIPGPDHPIAIERNPARVRIVLDGHAIADSTETLTLREASYPPVHYFPRKDVDMSLLTRTDHHSYCPYKGEASYYSIPAGGTRTLNAVWTYERPHAAMAAIGDYLAFYTDRVDTIIA